MSAKKPALIPLAFEREGILFTAAALRWRGKVWIWLTSTLVDILRRHCPRAWSYQLDDERLATIDCAYPRFVLGYADSQCGRRTRGGILSEDVLVDARALHNLLSDVADQWPQSLALSALRELVRQAGEISLKGSASRAKHEVRG